jgi:hypothetical protein
LCPFCSQCDRDDLGRLSFQQWERSEPAHDAPKDPQQGLRFGGHF